MVTRLDLDGVHSPRALAAKIFEAEPNLEIPVPIERLASQLDIEDIRPLQTEGFLGGLITNEARSLGYILVKKGLAAGRRRFTIAHELGHFLNPFHKLTSTEGFLCDRSAMKRLNEQANNTVWRIEAEANAFASLILMPPPKIRALLKKSRYTGINAILDIHRAFDVSKEAAARVYTAHASDAVAVLMTRDRRLLYAYRQKDFPRLDLGRGDPIPDGSRLYLDPQEGRVTDSDPTDPAHWIHEGATSSVNALYEQVLVQTKGFAMIHLKALLRDEDQFDPEGDLTATQRWKQRTDRWS